MEDYQQRMFPMTQGIIPKGGKEQVNLLRASYCVPFLGGIYILNSVLKMWCRDQPHQHHLGTLEELEFLGPHQSS